MISPLRSAAQTDAPRAVVFTGNGRAFCSGGDLREMQALSGTEGRIEAFLEAPLGALHGVIKQMRELPIPIIGAINGVCAGAGVNFALACDIVLAAEDATFREAFVRYRTDAGLRRNFLFAPCHSQTSSQRSSS